MGSPTHQKSRHGLASQFLCPKIGLILSLRRFLCVCDRLHIIDVITLKYAIKTCLIHSFRVLGACLSCLQVYKEALNIDVSYKKAVFRAFFCFSFPFARRQAHIIPIYLSPNLFFLVCFSYSYIFLLSFFPVFFFRLLIFPFILILSFLPSFFVSFCFFFFCFFCLLFVVLCVVVLQSHTTLVNYSSIAVLFPFSLHRLICVYIIYIYQCICVYINRDIHYTYYILIYS